MVQRSEIILKLSVSHRWRRVIAWALYPAVWGGFIPVDRAIVFAMRFVRVRVLREC